jgi:hypothetical protein
MDFKDLLLTPIYLPFIFLVALMFRRRLCDRYTKKYFMPAFTLKIIGAISLGLIYQFYYKGGDTYNYFHDTKVVWQAFTDSPLTAIRIVFADGDYHYDLYEYTRRIYFYVDPYSFHVIRLAGFLSFFTFNTYTLIAIFFAVISFTGVWAMYKVFYHLYPHLHKKLAIAVFFIPSVFFWGSGLMKDTITLGALGWAFYGFYFGMINRKNIISNMIILSLSLLVIKAIKVYILLCFLPAAFFWVFLEYRARIKSRALKFFALPFTILISVPIGYFAIVKVTEDNARYQLENIATTTQVTAEWLTQMGTQQKGSVYSLGEFDGTFTGMLSKFPQAVVVTLYRPFIWEVRNPVMLLSALEAMFFLYLTIQMFRNFKIKVLLKMLNDQPVLLFCFVFSITFAFAVGISSYNFGTLVRYKIPMMPFFLAALYIIQSQSEKKSKRPKKLRQLA